MNDYWYIKSKIIMFQVLMAASVSILYWCSKVFLTLIIWSKASLSSLSRWLSLQVCPLPVLDSTRPKMAFLIYLWWSALVVFFFFMALYRFTNTTSGMIYWFYPCSKIIVNVASLSIILKTGWVDVSSEPKASSIHRFISPAITINYHFFSKAFISISSLKA